MSERVTLFIQDTTGDHNFEAEYGSFRDAEHAIERMRKDGGYWRVETDEETEHVTEQVFVPWHRVDFCRIEPIEEEEAE